MRRLFILDHSLIRVGGHHFVSVSLLAEAARRQGIETIVATHRIFSPRQWPVDCALVPVFPFSTYAGFSTTVGKADRPLDPLRDDPAKQREAWPTRFGAVGSWWWRWRQRRHVLGFAAALRKVFERFPLQQDDVVFVPTLSEFDLVGLGEFLKHFPDASRAIWHLQFHYPLVSGGWKGDAEQLARVADLQQHFAKALAGTSHVRLHCHAPTPQLAAQYERLGIGPFPVPPTPVKVLPKEPTAADDADRPLRVLCAGGFRRGKSVGVLGTLIEELQRTKFCDGRVQLWVQAGGRGELTRRSDGHDWVTVRPERDVAPQTARLIHVPHPLSMSEYRTMQHGADIGLLAYDPKVYAVRQSGVLTEFLSLGTPVVVPANTWMAYEVGAAATSPSEPVAVVVPTADDYARGLVELVSNFDTYREHARRISANYAAANSPEAMLRYLIAASGELAEAAS